MPENNKIQVISYVSPKSVESEAYRALRTNLEFSMSADSSKVVLITSSHVGEGKSTVSSNLAVVFAMQGKKTVLVDADLRRGTQHKILNVEENNGLSNYLSNVNYDEKKFIKKTSIENLSVVTCGTYPPNPSELLTTDRMKQLLDDLKQKFDVVIIDGAPIGPVADSLILARIVDKILLVVASREAHKDEIKAIKASIENVGAKISGVVLNKIEMGGNAFSKYGSYGKYGKYGKYGSYSYAYYTSSDDTTKKDESKKEDSKK